MRINELLIESQQLDEGPFTQAIGKGAGKVARGIANIGKDLKTGFKAGYSGEQPAAAPATAAPATAAPATAAPAKKAAAPAAPAKKAAAPATAAPTSAIDQLKQGFAQGQGEPAQAEPAANPEAEKQSKIGVGQINKIIPTLRTRDLMSLQANLEKTIASKKKAAPAPAANAAPAPAANAAPAPAANAAPAPAANAAPAPGSDAAKDELYGAGNRPKGAKDKVAALKSKNKKKAAPTQAEIDADRDRLMGNVNDSIERHKQRMVAEGFANGTISIFKQ
jgi:hypothetical protein